MSDLFASLVIPKGSQESFHSTHSQPAPAMSSSPTQDQLQTSLHQTIPTESVPGLALHEVDAFLDRPDIKSLLESTTKKATQASTPVFSASTAAGSSLPVATQLGTPTSSASVSRFYEACQEKGLTPVFEIEQDEYMPQGLFKGKLSVGSEIIVLEQPQLGKKEARQLLAGRGLEVVKGMEARVKRKDDSDTAPNGSGENWVGKLLEFFATHPTLPTPTFTTFTHGPSFACEVLLPQRPTPFGGRDILYTSKRLAKTCAAREAVTYLMQCGLLNPDGSLKKTKTPKLSLGIVVEPAATAAVEKSWGQKVNELCHVLGFGPPEYRLAPADPERAPNVFSGAAWFAHEPALRGPVAEVRHVFGKKKAKEECARGVWAVLDGIRRKRLGVE